MGLALDGLEENDLSFEQDGIRFAMKEDIVKMVGDVTIDYSDDPRRQGFIITTGAGGGHCGGCEG